MRKKKRAGARGKGPSARPRFLLRVVEGSQPSARAVFEDRQRGRGKHPRPAAARRGTRRRPGSPARGPRFVISAPRVVKRKRGTRRFDAVRGGRKRRRGTIRIDCRRMIPLDKVLLICRSQTEALALKRMLSGAGVTGRLVRPPRSLAVGSCSFAVSIPRCDYLRAQQRMRDKNYAPCRVV